MTSNNSIGNSSKNGSSVDFVVRFGGEGGDGVISCGEMLAQAISRTDYHVFTYISYPAEIRGGFSSIQIRIQNRSIYSMGSIIDYLVVFNQIAIDRTLKFINEKSMIIYDPDLVELPQDLENPKFALPIEAMAKSISGGKRGKNIIALGAMGFLFNIDIQLIKKLITDKFQSKGDKVVEMNFQALESGYEYAKNNNWQQRFNLITTSTKKSRYIFISGNEAIALGAIVAGCRFVAGYPITPATPILEQLLHLLPRVGGKAIQVEDEIAAISAIIGASFGGKKVLTPTSGPGLQLMCEQLNLASMIELPMVIVNVQRGGPSTGLPTKTEQSDLKFAIYGTSGEAPRIILAPTSVEDSFYQTIRAFNLSERYQMPVIILTDQSIGYRKATVRIPDADAIEEVASSYPAEEMGIPNASRIKIINRKTPTSQELKKYKRYKITKTGISPIAIPGTPHGQYLSTGLEHTETGKADYSPRNHRIMMEKRFTKLQTLSKIFEMNPPEYYGSDESQIGIIGWGSTKGAIREACEIAEKKGILIRHLHPEVISPLPDRQIRRFLSNLKLVMVVEENYTGQFAHFIKAKFGIRPIEVHKCEGVPINSSEIYNAIKKVSRIVNEKTITKL